MGYKNWNNLLGWIVWLIASIVYISTIEPTASFWDCGEFIASAYNLEVGHPPGAPLFMLVGRFFTIFASNETAGYAINILSALSSSFTILFLFWSITAIVKKMTAGTEELTQGKTLAIFGSALVGSLAYTFSDSFWFSAVEAEVYSMSSLFTALIFWVILKWETHSEEKQSMRYIVLISYLIGLSIGVHLLNLLAIPAMVFLYYFKNRALEWKNVLRAMGISFFLLGLVQFGIIPGTVKIGSLFELFFVNGLGAPFHSGLIFYILLLMGLCGYGLYYTQTKGKAMWNTVILSFAVILIGYSTYTVIVVRSIANPPMDENNPENAFSLLSYLNREQYGAAPFISGQYFNTPLDAKEPYKEGSPVYYQNKETGKYEQTNKGEKNKYNYDKRTSGFFPRMWSAQSHHVTEYKRWTDFKGKNVKASNGKVIKKPTLVENMRFLFRYQLGFMYWRYLMWNFAGRQNDIQGHGEINNGNWISGIKFLDAARLGNQDMLPSSMTENKAHNKYYLLPFLLGIIGLLYQLKYAPKDGVVLLLFFFFTGIAIHLFLNQTPMQPRERDYAYVGSFYVFAIWIGLSVYALTELLSKKLPQKVSAILVTAVCMVIAPVLMASENWDDHNRAKRYTARDFAKNYLNSCPPNAILFTNGDNDTFPLWYLQEVERYRTDVRVVNLSLLNTDWYVEQMRRAAWDADGIPQRLPAEKLIQGTNDMIPIYDRGLKGHIDVDEAIDFVKDDSPRSKITIGSGKQVDYLPTKKFKIAVDKEKVLANGTVRKEKADQVVDFVEWTINKNYITKNSLIVLDILAANDWERPVCFAITTGKDSYLGLTDYFQIEGLAYRLVPYKATRIDRQLGEVNTEVMYDNLMNKFEWGGMDKDIVYMDENNRRMCMNLRNNFSRLADVLILKGENEKALQLLDKCVASIPAKNVPYDYFALPLVEAYYKLKEYEKGNEIVRVLIDKYEEELNYFLSLRGDKRRSTGSDLERTKLVMQQIMMLTTNRYKDSGIADEMQDRFTNINQLLVSGQ